jgi:Ca-activated chloride channel family protein
MRYAEEMRLCVLVLVLVPLVAHAKPGPVAPKPAPERRYTFHAVASRPNVWMAAKEVPRAIFALGMGLPRDYAWCFAREYLRLGRTPHSVEVNADGFYNAFDYDDALPKEGWFATTVEGAPSPFTAGRQLVRVAVRGPAPTRAARPKLGISFIVPTDGGGDDPRRFGLVKQMMKSVLDALQPDDTVQLTTGAGLSLAPTPVRDRKAILAVIDALKATHQQRCAGTGGRPDEDVSRCPRPEPPALGASLSIWVNIGTATGMHKDFFVAGVPITAKNFDDYLAQTSGAVFDSYRIIGNLDDAHRALARELPEMIEQRGQNLRVEIAFDPAVVRSYRLLGFNHGDGVQADDFADGRLYLGAFGAGFALSALYEVELAGPGDRLGTVTVRAEKLGGGEPKQSATALTRAALRPTLAAASADFRFATAAAGAGDVFAGPACQPGGPAICSSTPSVLRYNLPAALALARGAVAGKPDRKDFVRLISAAPGARGK